MIVFLHVSLLLIHSLHHEYLHMVKICAIVENKE